MIDFQRAVLRKRGTFCREVNAAKIEDREQSAPMMSSALELVTLAAKFICIRHAARTTKEAEAGP